MKPSYEELTEALLSFIFFNGGEEFKVKTRSTYDPLAEYFRLTQEERHASHPDWPKEKLWENRIRWTRQRLINSGSLDGSERGVWRLTPKGVNEASAISQQFLSLKK